MEVFVDFLGARASHIIAQDQNTWISGVTSRGSFVSTLSGVVLFLSGETYRGPLTLNLKGNDGIFSQIHPGDAILIRDRNLYWSKTGILISTDEAKEWKPSDLSNTVLSPIERTKKINKLCRLAPFKLESFSPEELEGVRLALLVGSETNLIDALIPFLGRGTGLTPSGDDLIVGFLLSLNRWGRIFHPHLKMEGVNLSINQEARQRTTTLSASLIECAAQAQADERLILALDSLVTGKPDLTTCVSCLRNYGSSSGVDTLLGMVLAMNNPERQRCVLREALL